MHCLLMLKVTVHATVAYKGANLDAVTKVINSAVEACIEGIKEKTNVFEKITLDIPALKVLEVENFNPFKVKETIFVN